MKKQITKLVYRLLTMTEDKQIDELTRFLKSNYGFKEVKDARETDDTKKSSSRGQVSCTYYVSKEVDTVFAVIYSKSLNIRKLTLFDKKIYEDVICKYGCTLFFKLRGDDKIEVRVRCNVKNWNHYPLHQLVLGMHAKLDGENREVDHIYKNTLINTMESLRKVTSQENHFNNKFYSTEKESAGKWSFSAPDHIDDEKKKDRLKRRGYSFKRNKIWSPSFTTEYAMYSEINRFEKAYLKRFRYKPLQDFSETWYVYALYKLTMGMKWKDVKEINREYMKKNHLKIARYYKL